MSKFKVQISDEDLRSSHLPPEHLQCMGRVASEAAFLDMMIEKAIWRLLDLQEPIGRCVTTHLPSKTRLAILRTLANEFLTNKDGVDDLDELIIEINDVQMRRNRIVHDLWTESGKPGHAWRAHHIAKKTLKLETELHSPEDINRLADKTKLTALKVGAWSALASLLPIPSLDKS